MAAVEVWVASEPAGVPGTAAAAHTATLASSAAHKLDQSQVLACFKGGMRCWVCQRHQYQRLVPGLAAAAAAAAASARMPALRHTCIRLECKNTMFVGGIGAGGGAWNGCGYPYCKSFQLCSAQAAPR